MAISTGITSVGILYWHSTGADGGWGWQSVHEPKVLPKALEQWNVSIATGKMFDMEFPLRGADGIFRPFITRVLPLKDAKGNVIQWFGTNTDVSELKNAEAKLKETLENLENLVKERTAELERAFIFVEGKRKKSC